ncbi:aldehyde dehydrogenase family protein [Candidatus Gracilibacteria bacterium]|nr:aldehyde dehydrogenase family protein [Candidatus Gracilibacteria bacterium]
MELLTFEKNEIGDFLELKILSENINVKFFIKNEIKLAGVMNYKEDNDRYVIPNFINCNNKKIHFGYYIKNKVEEKFINEKYKLKIFNESIDYPKLKENINNFIEYLINKKSDLQKILSKYETLEVFNDEFERSIDLLTNIDENKEYFVKKVDQIASFLPKNQPLYAFCCFVIIPSLMSKKVIAKKPAVMQSFFDNLIDILNIKYYFPNIKISDLGRVEFIDMIKGEYEDKNGNTQPCTDVIIFTGTMENADNIRMNFSEKTLFISNGAGHNPLIITDTANISDSISASISLQLYNQGQDCAAPSTILVHEKICDEYVKSLLNEIKKLKVGDYNKSNIGPITEAKDMIRIQKIFVDNIDYINKSTPGLILSNKSLVYPTVIEKPLEFGGNYTEQFAPIFFIQKYNNDSELRSYFETNKYRDNAMYVTVYGDSKYVNNILGKSIGSLGILHKKDTFLHNINLHSKGVERGIKPYGGYGRGASNFSIFGNIISKPTLPQRDIYENLICNSEY